MNGFTYGNPLGYDMVLSQHADLRAVRDEDRRAREARAGRHLVQRAGRGIVGRLVALLMPVTDAQDSTVVS